MEYRGLITKLEYSQKGEVYHGKVENIRDLVDFEGETPEEAEHNFHEAVDEYFKFCREVGK